MTTDDKMYEKVNEFIRIGNMNGYICNIVRDPVGNVWNVKMIHLESKAMFKKSLSLNMMEDMSALDIFRSVANCSAEIANEPSNVKKLFISVPMKGMSNKFIEEAYDNMAKIAEIAFGEELDILNRPFPMNPPEGISSEIWDLGDRIEKLSQADYFIGIDWCEAFPNCHIEYDVARNYGIESMVLQLDKFIFLKDALEVEKAFYNDRAIRPNVL